MFRPLSDVLNKKRLLHACDPHHNHVLDPFTFFLFALCRLAKRGSRFDLIDFCECDLTM